MSNVETAPVEIECGREEQPEGAVHELLPGREVVLGGVRGMAVSRTLPHRDRRMVGAWCFVDQYGPADHDMRVPPHPHTGLQTVTWLLAGDVLHRDSLGSEALVRPGQLNLMTAGHGIAHSEESPAGRTGPLHGVQLWVALPEHARSAAPHFESHRELPVLSLPGATVTVLMGELGGAISPAKAYTPIVGAEASVFADTTAFLPLRPDFEYAALVLDGAAAVDGVDLTCGTLLYLGHGRDCLEIRTGAPARVLLLGGEPFAEEIVMWWNFVGRSHDDVAAAREQWMAADARFGEVTGYDGEPLPAPVLPATPLKPRGRVR
ncbi:pirin family protein [Catellatospora sp. KI3]|uniref:pirin family protein n=1 Tax=Catellatospora sp. KI3 TaxID=3041620 RepID=UPI002482BF87|nr:pirin family protein [Catellatospora sp. KI3]MDI1465743.1 pirin family protein [Catellatospora sp. KI3]